MSHPSWVCGLKLSEVLGRDVGSKVTPFVGVWIETHFRWSNTQACMVTPFVGVWIETYIWQAKGICQTVTPFVGVWIETVSLLCYYYIPCVTPFVGVWIETALQTLINSSIVCHTLRGCVD